MRRDCAALRSPGFAAVLYMFLHVFQYFITRAPLRREDARGHGRQMELFIRNIFLIFLILYL